MACFGVVGLFLGFEILALLVAKTDVVHNSDLGYACLIHPTNRAPEIPPRIAMLCVCLRSFAHEKPSMRSSASVGQSLVMRRSSVRFR